MTEHTTISGDVRTPEGVAHYLDTSATAVADTAATCEQACASLGTEGVEGLARDLLMGMHAAGMDYAAKRQARAQRFAGHIADRDELINDELAGVVSGGYMDPDATAQ